MRGEADGQSVVAQAGAVLLGTHGFLDWLTQRRWLSYSVGMTITDAIQAAVLAVPASTWTPAVEPDGGIRDGAWVAELDGDCRKDCPQQESTAAVVQRCGALG